MTIVRVHIDKVGYEEKPNGLYGKIKPRLQCDDTIQEIQISDLVEKIGQGYAISPGIMSGGYSADNWNSQDLFMIDIDNDTNSLQVLDLNKALEICKTNNIYPTFAYFTYSHSENIPRFRLAFVMNKTITDKKDRIKIIRTLISLFPNCDVKCDNADRIFLGTNKKTFLYNENATINMELIDNIITSSSKSNSNLSSSVIVEGKRNNTLFIKACELSELNLSYEEIMPIIEKENNEKCNIPLPDKEIETLVKSAIKHVNDIPPYIIRTIKNNKPQYNVSSQLLAQFIRDNAHYFLVKNNANEKTMIYWYEDGVYKNINDDMFKGYIKAYIQDYRPELYRSSIVNEVYKDLITDLNFINQDKLNDNEDLINFTNGLYNIKTKELMKHTPNIMTTIQIPCEWNDTSDINAPVFLSYIDKLTDNDTGKKSLLLQYMGACISNIKGHRFKKALFIVGDGDTGKSQLKSLIEKMLGKENYTSIDLSELEERFGTSMLYNKRLAGSSDMTFASVRELKQFKKITGGDSIFAEFKGCQGFDYVYSGLLWFCCNRLPKFSGDNGKWVYDRIIVIRCNNVIPKSEQDKYLLDKMYAERESIVRLTINELQLAIDNGYEFVITDEIKKESELYRQTNSTIASFINECCTKRETYNDNCTCKKMYDVYVEYCKDNNNGYAKTQKEFKQELIELSNSNEKTIIKRTSQNNFYVPYTITLDTYIAYYKVFGYSQYFEKLRYELDNNT